MKFTRKRGGVNFKPLLTLASLGNASHLAPQGSSVTASPQPSPLIESHSLNPSSTMTQPWESQLTTSDSSNPSLSTMTQPWESQLTTSWSRGWTTPRNLVAAREGAKVAKFDATKFNVDAFSEGAREIAAARVDNSFLDDAVKLSSGATHTTYTKVIDGKKYVLKPYTPGAKDMFGTDDLGIQLHMYASSIGVAPPSLPPVMCNGKLVMVSEFVPYEKFKHAQLIDEVNGSNGDYAKLNDLNEKINASGINFKEDSFISETDGNGNTVFRIWNGGNVRCNDVNCYVTDVDAGAIAILKNRLEFLELFPNGRQDGTMLILDGFVVNLSEGFTIHEQIENVQKLAVNHALNNPIRTALGGITFLFMIFLPIYIIYRLIKAGVVGAVAIAQYLYNKAPDKSQMMKLLLFLQKEVAELPTDEMDKEEKMKSLLTKILVPSHTLLEGLSSIYVAAKSSYIFPIFPKLENTGGTRRSGRRRLSGRRSGRKRRSRKR